MGKSVNSQSRIKKKMLHNFASDFHSKTPKFQQRDIPLYPSPRTLIRGALYQKHLAMSCISKFS